MPAPSNLPDFNKLADEIGAGCRSRQKDSPGKPDELPDEYLGSLHDGGAGVRVHDIASKILLRKDSKPTPLHEALLKVFFPTTPVRLVTTNFDQHFTAVADGLGIEAPTYTAPALPLGNDFEGLVYLHGACWARPNKIVLTDGDFGRAYLTEAWASRFLYQMFLTYTVLFVGYSHDDVVMKYIAKGLPTNLGPRRFILTEKRTRQWKPYGIHPLYYDLQNGNSHHALTEGIQEWVIETHRGLYDKSEKIRSIVEIAPPLFRTKDDHYLRDAVQNEETARFFRNYTKRAEYLEWARNHGILKPLFSPEPLDKAKAQIAEWFIDHCIPSHNEETFAVFQNLGPNLNPEICQGIATTLICGNKPELRPVFGRWVAILLSQPATTFRHEQWELLLRACQWPDDRDIAIMLLERCFYPSILVKESLDFEAFQDSKEARMTVDYTVNITEEDSFELSEAWKEFFKPHLAELSEKIEPIVTVSFENADSLLRIGRKPELFYDPLGISRENIRHRRSFGGELTLDVLIDAALDLMDFSIKNNHTNAHKIIDRWGKSECLILNRIATQGLADSTRRSADEKIRWLREKDIQFLIIARVEIQNLLGNTYRLATHAVRLNFINYLHQELLAASNQSREQLEIFDLIKWIYELDPKCELASNTYSEVRDKYPQLVPRSPRQDDSDQTESRTTGDDINFEDIVSHPPSKWIDAFMSQPKTEKLNFHRAEKAYAIRGAVIRSFNWGLEAQKYLATADIYEPAIWNQLFNGWREAKLEPNQWERLIAAFEELPTLEPWANGIAEVLCEGTRREEHAMPRALFEKAWGLSLKAFAVLTAKKPFLDSTSKDWLGLAINRPGGKIAEFWLQYLVDLRKHASEDWVGLPAPVKDLFRQVIKSSSDEGKLARVVLVSQLHYLFSLDRDFSNQFFSPLLDWSRDHETACQSWQGFLGWGRWTSSFLNQILPFYHRTLEHLGEFEEMTQGSFVQHIASIAVYGVAQPWTISEVTGDGVNQPEPWLPKYLLGFTPSNRRKFAETLRRILKAMSPAASAELWKRWLKQYWLDRINCVPVALDSDEVNNMVSWPLYLRQYFPEAVALLGRSPKFTSVRVNLERDIPVEYKSLYTEATGKYLNLLLGSMGRGDHRIATIRKIYEELLARGLPEDVSRDIRDSLRRLE